MRSERQAASEVSDGSASEWTNSDVEIAPSEPEVAELSSDEEEEEDEREDAGGEAKDEDDSAVSGDDKDAMDTTLITFLYIVFTLTFTLSLQSALIASYALYNLFW